MLPPAMESATREGQPLQEALDRVLASATFARSDRVSKLLRFLVGRHLEGRDDELKESVIGVEVFGRKPGYDPKLDSTVRTEAVRLRARLNTYYSTEGSQDPFVIELPKGRYVPRCRPRPADARQRLKVEDFVAVPAQPDQPVTPAESAAASCDAILVLPLKILRGRPDAEFLAFSLPDAIASSLADHPTIAVRSPLAVQRHGGAEADLEMLAEVMSARFALTGTLACVDERIGIRLQLLAIPAGRVLWSTSRVATLQELFEVQDAVAVQVARALPANMAARPFAERPRDVPKNAGAYAFYLRANQLAYEASHWEEARDLYNASVEADPDYAPAWARLARCERLTAKYSLSPEEARACLMRAERGFRRALALNPDLPIGHSFYAQLMIDDGRADEAMRRLLVRARRHPTDSELYAGLTHALRYCGLLDASVAAHTRARALDPTIPTSIHHTWWMKGEYERALAETLGDIGYMQGLALASLGRETEAIAALRWREREATGGTVRPFLTSLRALLEGDHEGSLAALETAAALQIDAEGLYYFTRTFARLGACDRAVRELCRVVDRGFWCTDIFVSDPWLDSIRGREEVRLLLERTAYTAERARSTFVELGGAELLGLESFIPTPVHEPPDTAENQGRPATREQDESTT